MSLQKFAKHISAGLVIPVYLLGTPANAVTVSGAVLEAIVLEENGLSTADLNTRVARFLLECLCDAITGQRSAGGTALADGGALATTPGHPPTNWFGDTGFLSAVSDGTDSNFASAFAQNKPVGKIAEAGVTGAGSAEAFLTWNGDVKFVRSATTGATATADDLPEAQQVVSATVTFTYEMTDAQLTAGAGGSGAVGVEFAWNGETTFSGGSAFDQNTEDGAPTFSGDLAAFSGSFSTADFSIETDDLSISQEVTLTLSDDDILAFFGTGSGLTRLNIGEFTASFGGSLSAAAAGAESNGDDDDKEVPEPEAFIMFALGLLGIGMFRRSRRKR